MTPDRNTLIALERKMRGKPGVGIVRAELRQTTHDMLRRELALKLLPEWRTE